MDMKRMSISISPAQETAILNLRKRDEYCRFSYAEIIRMLLNEGIKQIGPIGAADTNQTT